MQRDLDYARVATGDQNPDAQRDRLIGYARVSTDDQTLDLQRPRRPPR